MAFDAFSDNVAETSTVNRQISFQTDEGVGVGVSGRNNTTVAGSFYQAPEKIKVGNNSSLVMTDYGAVGGALHFAEQVNDNAASQTMAALQAMHSTAAQALDVNGQVTQALLETNEHTFNTAANVVGNVALQATNAAQQISINSLAVAKGALEQASDVALKATPVQAGDYALATSGQQSSTTKILIIAAAVVAGFLVLRTKLP